MKGNFLYNKIGRCIEKTRKSRGLSQDALAYVADMDRSHLAKLEEGKINPSIRSLHKIARKLKVSVGFFLKDI